MAQNDRRPFRKTSFPISWVTASLLALGLLAYANSFDAPFVFDDFLTVQRNMAVRFGEFNWNPLSGRALLYLTFTLNSIWSGQEVWSYHLFNLALHVANGILVFLIADHLLKKAVPDPGRRRIAAWIAAAVFLVHPVQTESVTYISSRSELLSTLFYAAALLLFMKRSARTIGWAWVFPIGGLFVLALSSKETAVTLPVALLLYDFLFLSEGNFRAMASRWRFHLALLTGTAAAAIYVGTVTLRGSIGPSAEGNLSVASYFATELRVLIRYIFLIFFPVGLNLDYDFPPSHSFFEIKVLLSAATLMCLFIFALKLRRRDPVLSFAILWFLLTLAPTSSFVPILDVIFEHRLYLPLLGMCLAAPILLDRLADLMRRWFELRVQVHVYAVVLVAAFLVGTILRNNVWRDEVRLYEDIVSKSPQKARGYVGLAWTLNKLGDYPRAIETLEKATSLLPHERDEFADLLGKLYLQTGRFPDAKAVAASTINSSQGDPEKLGAAWNNLGVVHLSEFQAWQARPQTSAISAEARKAEMEAILRPAKEAFAESARHDPAMLWAVDSYVNVSRELGELEAVATTAQAELTANPSAPNPAYVLGKVAFLKQDWSAADGYFQKATGLRPPDKLLFFNHGFVLERLGRLDDARTQYLNAIREDPIFIEARYNLSLIDTQQGRQDEALEHLKEVLRYNPGHRGANLNLARLSAGQGDKDAARTRLRLLLNANPNDGEAIQTWQQLGL